MLFNGFILLATFVRVGTYASTVATKRDGGPVVNLNYATFEGATTGGVDSFLGVPYAQPPVGDLRFRRPRPPLPLPGTTLVSNLTSFYAFLWTLDGDIQPSPSRSLSGHDLWKCLFAAELHPTLHSGPQLHRVGHIRFESQCIRRLYACFCIFLS